MALFSPLSRAIDTADLVFPTAPAPRFMAENLREINGWLLNGKRRTRSELHLRYPRYDQSNVLTDEDVLWRPEGLEEDESVRARVNGALKFIWERPETIVAVVAHGGLFKKMCDGNKMVRTVNDIGRFENCQLKSCTIKWNEEEGVFEVEELKLPN